MLFCPETAFNNVIGQNLFLLKEVGINLTFSVSGYRSFAEVRLSAISRLSAVTRFCPKVS